jgi:hypothetical protein
MALLPASAFLTWPIPLVAERIQFLTQGMTILPRLRHASLAKRPGELNSGNEEQSRVSDDHGAELGEFELVGRTRSHGTGRPRTKIDRSTI